MRRVLIVAYYFPPLGGIGSLRVTGFATHLPEFGWEPVVLAPRQGAYQRDPELSFPEEQVVRSGSLELSRAGKRMLRTGGDDVRPAQVSGVRAGLRGAARAIVYHPDPQVGWYVPAVLAGRRELRRKPADAILSSSFPITAHLVARRLQRATGLPWVADFRDPWSEMRPAGIARRRAGRLERKLARAASAVTMTSPSWAERHAELWDRPVQVMPNGHELDAAPAPPPDELVVSYLGSYYPETQDLSAAWAAIRRLADDGLAVRRIRFIGTLHPALRAQLADVGLASLVEETGFVSHEHAIGHLRRSSVLLLAGPRDAGGILRGQVAGKLTEYLASGLPIVYVGDLDCDAAALLRSQPGCHVHATDDVDGIARALAQCPGRLHARDMDCLSRRALTGRLAKLLDDLTTDGKQSP